MKRWRGLALAACLLLAGCGAEEGTEKEPAQELPQAEQQPVVETIPPVEELPVMPDYVDWQEAYAALLEEKAERLEYLRNVDRPDYDPDTVYGELEEVSGSYCVYDIDKDGTPELLASWCSSTAARHTTFYTFTGGKLVELGDRHTGGGAFYHWPEENAVAFNWAKMGGHTVTKLSIVEGKLTEEPVFEEHVPTSPYTDIGKIVPDSFYLRENRTHIEMPQVSALTLPIHHYGKDRTAQPLDPDRDALAHEKIEEALSGFGAFYGVSADGFGGDTGWTNLEDYLAPSGVTPYNDLPMEVREISWLDFNGDGQREALLTIAAAGADDYEDTKQVIFSWEDEAVYAYCSNYMESYDLTGTVFTSRYDHRNRFAVDFDGPQFYAYGVEE